MSSLSSPQAAAIQWRRQRPLSLSLSLSLTVALSSLLQQLEVANKFALGHIYTDMTFGLFTNIASTALGNIFTNMSPHPVSTLHRARIVIRLRSRACTIRLHAGYSSSGSLRDCRPRSSGSVRVYLAGSGHPIRRDRTPNRKRPAKKESAAIGQIPRQIEVQR